MKVSFLLPALLIGLSSASAVWAENYEGVLSITSERMQSEVHAEAVAAARTGDVYADGASAGVQEPLTSPAVRADVRSAAASAAHAPNQNLDPRAFYNSRIPEQFSM